MRRFLIFLLNCVIGISVIYSQSLLQESAIIYDSEQEFTNQFQGSQLNNSDLQSSNKIQDRKIQDSKVLLNYHSVKTFKESVLPIKSPYDLSKSLRLTVIVVYHSPDTSEEHGIWGVLRDGKQITGLTDRRLIRQKSQYQYPVKERGIPLINTSMQSFSKIRGKSDSNHFVLGSAIVSDSILSTLTGDIAECFVFSRFLKKTEALKIETYLAIKYGISLIESDYLSSKDVILWNYAENKDYSQGIAGIGKDSIVGLNQKQGCSSEEVGLLTISVGKFASLNKDNNFSLMEAHYLVWGHNGKELRYNELSYDSSSPLPDRKWLIQATYTDTNKIIPTTVKFQIPERYRDTSRICYLVIDRSGTGDFTSEDVEYIVQNSKDTNGLVYFNHVIWDTDGSGKDVFTFSFGPEMDLVATPSCSTSPTGNISIILRGGQSPISYLLVNNTTNQQYTYVGGRDYSFSNLPVGLYTLTAIDINHIPISKEVEVGEIQPITSTLPLRYIIKQGINLLDAEEYFGGSFSYVWAKDSVYFSDASLVDLSQSGQYQLSVTDTNGCSYIFSTMAEENFSSQKQKSIFVEQGQEAYLQQEHADPAYKVYPNPTSGRYTIEARMSEESWVIVRVYSSNGSLIDTWEDSGKKHYFFNSYLSTTGNYIIEIRTIFGTKDFKLVVVK
jgi:hypothetical protein